MLRTNPNRERRRHVKRSLMAGASARSGQGFMSNYDPYADSRLWLWRSAEASRRPDLRRYRSELRGTDSGVSHLAQGGDDSVFRVLGGSCPISRLIAHVDYFRVADHPFPIQGWAPNSELAVPCLHSGTRAILPEKWLSPLAHG